MNYCVGAHWYQLPVDKMEFTLVDEGIFDAT